jgi:glutamate-1-semialdehyde 2,1-aminomutase
MPHETVIRDQPTSAITSKELFDRARRSLAGGISHPIRYVEPHPMYIARAAGSHKWDVEGNEFVDFSMGSAALMLGHAHPAVVAALQEQAAKGTHYAGCHLLEIEWAELIQKLIPSAERIRFTNSGTEASMLAMRLARAYTGRQKVIRFESHYNGWQDDAAVGVLAPYDKPAGLGVLSGAIASTIVLPPTLAAVESAFAANQDVAAAIIEVSGAVWSSVPLATEFLAGLRALCSKRHVILIFDEVITGFRWSPGGVQALIGVVPDLTIMAKNVTGGMPGGAVGGRKEIMDLLDPGTSFKGLRPAVFHRGTFNGAAIVAAPAVATLKLLGTGEPQKRANRAAARIREGMQEVLATRSVEGVAYGESSTFHVYFGKGARGPVSLLEASQIRGQPKELVSAYRGGLRRRGVDLMSYMGGVTSSAHTDNDIDLTLEAFRGTIDELLERRLVFEHMG